MTSQDQQVSTIAQQREALAVVVNAVLKSGDLAEKIATICEQSRFRQYAPARTSWDVEGVEETVHQFLKHGDPTKAEKRLINTADTSEALHDLTRSVAATPIYQEIVTLTCDQIRARRPDFANEHLENRVAGAILDHAIDAIRRDDPSRPFDTLRGNQLNLIYVPSHDNRRQVSATRTSWWGSASDATTIKPDEAFVSFMKLANISKEAWLAALAQEGFDIDEVGELGDGETSERQAAWAKVNWTVSGEPLIDPAKAVHAVDLCPYGFTPFVAFAMDAYKVVNRKWSHAMTVSGGILGLHDFVYGSGNPIRFEGQCNIPARAANVFLHDRLKHNLSRVHGFTSQAFRSKVKDSNVEVALIEAQIAAEAHLAKLDLATLAAEAALAYRSEIPELVDIIEATGLDPDAINDALLTGVKDRAKHLAGGGFEPGVLRLIEAEVRKQSARVSAMDSAAKLAVLAEFHGPDEALATVKALAGYYDGPSI